MYDRIIIKTDLKNLNISAYEYLDSLQEKPIIKSKDDEIIKYKFYTIEFRVLAFEYFRNKG